VHQFERHRQPDCHAHGALQRLGPSAGALCAAGSGVGSNQDGRLEVFTIATDSQLWHAWQLVPNGNWSGWVPLGGNWPATSSPAALLNSAGRIEVFILGADRGIKGIKQVAPNGLWGGFVGFDARQWRGSPGVGLNADGRLEFFVEGDDRQLWHAWQTSPNGLWSGWVPLGGMSI
jgi:hypothetical protein